MMGTFDELVCSRTIQTVAVMERKSRLPQIVPQAVP